MGRGIQGGGVRAGDDHLGCGGSGVSQRAFAAAGPERPSKLGSPLKVGASLKVGRSMRMEATAGFEPTSTDLQSAA